MTFSCGELCSIALLRSHTNHSRIHLLDFRDPLSLISFNFPNNTNHGFTWKLKRFGFMCRHCRSFKQLSYWKASHFIVFKVKARTWKNHDSGWNDWCHDKKKPSDALLNCCFFCCTAVKSRFIVMCHLIKYYHRNKRLPNTQEMVTQIILHSLLKSENSSLQNMNNSLYCYRFCSAAQLLLRRQPSQPHCHIPVQLSLLSKKLIILSWNGGVEVHA